MFSQSRVLVVGLGGVGSWAAESLARTGVGSMVLADLDDICVTNTNRQLHTVGATIGRPKVEVMGERLRAIHPELDLELVHDFVDAGNIGGLLDRGFDVVVDAIDSYRDKLAIIEACVARDCPIVVAGAAGGRRDPRLVTSADLNRTTHDALLRKIRKSLRQSGNAGDRRKLWNIPAIYSTEQVVYPTTDGCVTRMKPDGHVAMDCAEGLGTAAHVTGTFGFVLADAALQVLGERASSI